MAFLSLMALAALLALSVYSIGSAIPRTVHFFACMVRNRRHSALTDCVHANISVRTY